MLVFLAYIGLMARIIALMILLTGVLPIMVRETRGNDYRLIRRTLPLILASYAITIFPSIFVVACRLQGCDYYEPNIVNLSSSIAGLNILLGALGWILIYRKG